MINALLCGGRGANILENRTNEELDSSQTQNAEDVEVTDDQCKENTSK